MWQMSRKNSLQYITSGHKTTTILVFFPKGLGYAVLLVRLLGKRFHSWLPLYLNIELINQSIIYCFPERHETRKPSSIEDRGSADRVSN